MKSEKEEIFALLDDAFHLINRFTGDFAKYCTSNECVQISKESTKFAVTIRVERKGEK